MINRIKNLFSVLITASALIMLNEMILISFSEDTAMKITSPVFEHNQMVPAKYTCQGDDINPRLIVSQIPKETRSLALIVDDPDAPMGTWTHWVVFDIPLENSEIKEDTIPGTQGYNNFGRNEWGGPCPPGGTHRYFFKIYALDTKLNLKEGAKKGEVERAMQDHILEKAELIGLYKKS